MGSTRQYDFITGVESSALPSAADPTTDDDFVTKGFADKRYQEGRLSVADITALKAIAADNRTDGMACTVESKNLQYIFDAGSAAAGDNQEIVEPDAGSGRWIKAVLDKADDQIVTGIKKFDIETEHKHLSTPAGNPDSGYVKSYFKSDNKFYLKNSGGTETLVGPQLSSESISAKSANYTITDVDNITVIAGTGGNTSFTFIDSDVDTTDDHVTKSGHGLSNGDAVYLGTTGAVPAGLYTGKVYFVVNVSGDDFKLSLTLGGSAVNITAATGGGTHTVYKGIVILMPLAANNTNRKITINKIDSGTGDIVIDGNGNETINGSTYYRMHEQFDTITVICDGTTWHVLDLITFPVQYTDETANFSYLNFGSVINDKIIMKRDGDSMIAIGTFDTGVMVAGEGKLIFPTRKTINIEKLVGTNQKDFLGTWHILDAAGPIDLSNEKIGALSFSTTDNVDRLYFARRVESESYKRDNMTAILDDGERVTFRIEVPISEWVLHD